MHKKRHENISTLESKQIQSKEEFYKSQTINTENNIDEGIVFKEYVLLPESGVGTILKITIDDIEITISNYKLNNDLIIVNELVNEEIVQLSFLLKGEKIISIEDYNIDIIYENQESYLATIDALKGTIKIFANVGFKEIKIKLKKSFMMNHSFNSQHIFNKKLNKDCITPINDELLSILNDFENSFLKENSKKLYLKAKILELLAIQIENYKKNTKKKK